MTADPADVTPDLPPATPRRAGRSRARTSVASFLWAAVPLATVGFGTWVVFLYAAIKRRSAWLGVASASYAALLGVLMVAEEPANPGGLALGIGTAAWGACMFGGFVHALAIRSGVFGGQRPRAAGSLRQFRRQALRRRRLRRKARAIAIRDPALARQLGIGRPDLRRDYDDGGLVDANSAPAAVLAALPGMTPELAGKAVELRAVRGPFVSADDLSIALGLRSDLLTALADVTVYPA